MYLILLKIHFYSSLSLLYSQPLKNLVERIIALVVQKGFKLRTNRDGYLLFSLDTRREHSEQILLDTAGFVEENLMNEDDWLNGYTIILDETNREYTEEVFYNLRNSTYKALQDNKIYVGEFLKTKKASEWNLGGQRGLPILDKLLLRVRADESNLSPFAEHPARSILEEYLLKKKKVRGPTLLIDKEIKALRMHVLDILKDLEHVYYLWRPRDYEEPYAHFVSVLGPLLKGASPLDDRFCGDEWFNDVKIILSNYLDDLGSNTVVYLIFEQFSEWDEEYHRYWENLLRGIARHIRPVFLECEVPHVKGMGEPIDLGTHGLDSIWKPAGLSKLLTTIDPLQKKIIFLCSLGQQPVDVKILRDFMVQVGEDPGIVEDKITLAIKNCLLTKVHNWVMSVELDPSVWPTLIFEDTQKLSKTWLLYQLNKSSNSTLAQTIGLLYGAGMHAQLLTALRQYFRTLINRRSPLLLRILDLPVFPKFFTASQAHSQEWQLLKVSVILQHWLDVSGHQTDLQKEILEVDRAVDSEVVQTNRDWKCQTARMDHLRGNLDQAYSGIRLAYSLSQKSSDTELEVLSALEIGQILIKRKKIDEAAEYFGIAWREAEKAGLNFLEAHAALWTGVARYIIGNLKSSEAAWKAAKELSSRYYFHTWSGLSSFLLGRLEFELGQYTKAIKHFENSAGVYGTPARLWVARSLCYSGQSEQSIRQLQKEATTRESEFFLVEALYFAGRIQEALNIARNWENLEYRPLLWQGFNWDLQTGFSCLEDRCLESDKDQTVLERQSLAFQDFLLLNYSDTGNPISVQRFEKICSDKNLSITDPYTHQYFLWYSLVLGKGQVEKNARWSTLMGRGLKELQTRGSKVDDRDDRVLFLNAPWWNAQLLNEAKKNKLL